MSLPGLSGIAGFSATATGGGGGPPGGSQRQVMVPGLPSPIYINTSAAADKQYLLPGSAYLNEQS